jgi:predicted Zn finger-like uncharacterized protein
MQATCTHCGARHVLDDKQIGGHARVRFRCTQCKQSTEVDIGQDSNRTSISSARAEAVPYVEPTVIDDQRGLGLPADKKITLQVTGGKSAGLAHDFDRPRMIIGRLGADVAIEDGEVSRWHCAIEVAGNEVHLRDLDSRNGVYVGEQRVKSAPLQNGSEFRIGSTILQLQITPK